MREVETLSHFKLIHTTITLTRTDTSKEPIYPVSGSTLADTIIDTSAHTLGRDTITHTYTHIITYKDTITHMRALMDTTPHTLSHMNADGHYHRIHRCPQAYTQTPAHVRALTLTSADAMPAQTYER